MGLVGEVLLGNGINSDAIESTATTEVEQSGISDRDPKAQELSCRYCGNVVWNEG